MPSIVNNNNFIDNYQDPKTMLENNMKLQTGVKMKINDHPNEKLNIMNNTFNNTRTKFPQNGNFVQPNKDKDGKVRMSKQEFEQFKNNRDRKSISVVVEKGESYGALKYDNKLEDKKEYVIARLRSEESDTDIGDSEENMKIGCENLLNAKENSEGNFRQLNKQHSSSTRNFVRGEFVNNNKVGSSQVNNYLEFAQGYNEQPGYNKRIENMKENMKYFFGNNKFQEEKNLWASNTN